MGVNVGSIDLGLDINQKGFNNQLNGIAGSAAKGIKGAFGGLGTAIGVSLGAAAVVSFTKSCLELGSNLSEVQNVVDVTFQKMNGSVNKFAMNAMEQFGLSETVTKKYMGTLGAMSKSMGFTEQQSYQMAESITGLSGDVASFYNLSSDEAYTKLKSIWTGETETLKELGVIMTQTNLDQYALNNGFGKTTKNMTEQQKVMLRYQYVMSSLSAAQGDFARTSDSWANQTRVLGLRFDSLKASLGQGFINLFTPIVKMINGVLIKLQSLADGFKTFTELITGKQATEQTNSAIASIGSGAVDAASNISGMGDAAASSAKKAQKALLGFDQVNTLPDNSDTSNSGSGGASGVGAAGSMLDDTVTATEATASAITSTLDKIKDKVLELTGLFKKGFVIGLGDTNFKDITKSLDGIKTSLKSIFTDPRVLSSANNYIESLVTTLGKITGSAASIGLTFTQLVFGSIDKYLSQNSKFIQDKFVNIFNIAARTQEIMGNFAVAIADIFTVFRSPQAQQIGADIIAIFTNSFLSVGELVMQFGLDVTEALTKPIIDNKDKIKDALKNTLSIVGEYIGGIKDGISGAFEAVKNSYDKYIQPAFEKFSSGASKVFGAVLDAYNTYLAPTFQKIAEKTRSFITDSLNPLVQKFTDFVGKVVDGIAEIWDKTIAPFIAWLIDKTAPKIAKFIKDISDNALGFWTVISKVVSDLLDALGGVVDFLVGVFTGDWKRAWEGIKTTFSSIMQAIKDILSPIGQFFKQKWDDAVAKTKAAFNGIKDWFKARYTEITGVFGSVGSWFKEKFDAAYNSVKNAFNPFKSFFSGLGTSLESTFKGSINAVINLFNKFIRWVNDKLSFNWDGLTIAGVKIFDRGQITLAKIPQIPALANGGYVGANQPRLAMIGDNRREGEIVSPESKLRQMAIEAARMAGGSGGLTEEGLYRVMARVFREFMHFYISEEDLARHVNNGNAMIDLMNNPVGGRY